MDTTPQWPQDVVVVKAMEPNPNSSSAVERKVRAHKEQGFNCPRCNSTNTKFCYYNNYSLSQPRFFCKACRRYWTQGGSLRNIPVGGGSRKNNKRTTSSSSYHNDNNNSKKLPADLVTTHSSLIPAGFKSIFETTQESQNPNPSSLPLPSSRVLCNNYELMPFSVVGTVFHHLPEEHQFYNKSSSSLSFSLEHGGLESNFGDFQGLQENINDNSSSSSTTTKKLLFPFEDLNQDQDQNHDHRSSDRDQLTKDHDHQNGDPTNGFWNGVIGGESW